MSSCKKLTYQAVTPGGPGSMKFYHALEKCNTPGVKHLVLKEGLDVNHRFPDGSFPVHIAAARGDVHSLRFLLSLRANPDLKNHHQQTALMLGIHSPDITQILVVEYNTTVDARDSQQRTALHLAVVHGHVPVVRILLAGGATVHALDIWKRSPLHVTLRNLSHGRFPHLVSNYSEMVRLLLDRGCDVNHVDNARNTPLFLAINAGSVDISRTLITRGANVDKVSRHRLTPIMLAVIRGFTELVQLLVWYNCDIHYTPSHGKTCSQLALEHGHLDILILLSATGQHVHRQTWPLIHGKHPGGGAGGGAGGGTGGGTGGGKYGAVGAWLEQHLSTPLPLQLVCRTQIRKCLGPKLHEKIAKLQYSEVLKKYILMRDYIPAQD